MPVDTTHPLFDKMVPIWARARDVLGGEDTVAIGGPKYLPRLTEQSDAEYAAYVARSHFFPASGRTHGGMLGLIFRRDPVLVTSPELEKLTADLTLTGQSLFGFAKELTGQVLGPGRAGVLVDFNEKEGRPYAVAYKTEQIRNWRVKRIQGKMVLTLVVLMEEDVRPHDDGFGATAVTNYRVLRLENGAYKVRLYTRKLKAQAAAPTQPEQVERAGPKAAEADEFDIVETIPSYRGTPLPFVPFSFIGVTKNDPDPELPPLNDVFTTNLSHWRNSADLEHGRHFTGLPTAWVAGFSSVDSKGNAVSLRIGSQTAWITDNPNAKAEFLEFTGQGLQSLEKALEQKKDEMAVLGARLLETQKRAAETAETMQIRSAGESSALSSIATTVGEAMTKTLDFMGYWLTGKLAADPKKISCTLNTDYVAAELQPQALTALVAAWQSAAISHETLLWNLQEGELLPPDVSPEDEIQRIAEEAPKLTGDPLALDETGNVPASQKDAQTAAAKTKAAADAAAADLATKELAAKNAKK